MKVTGPMFSMSASGTIGGVITAATWKGRAYFRSRVTPSNPRSPAQTANRAAFRFIGQNWATIGGTYQGTWELLAQQLAISPFNAYQRANSRYWTAFIAPTMTSDTDYSMTPGTVVTPIATAGVKQIVLTLSLSVAADNWGQVVFAKLGSAPTGVKSEVVAMVKDIDTANVTFVHSGLTIGETWHYKSRPFAEDGSWGTLSADANATVL